jgi:hypothetical protein
MGVTRLLTALIASLTPKSLNFEEFMGLPETATAVDCFCRTHINLELLNIYSCSHSG